MAIDDSDSLADQYRPSAQFMTEEDYAREAADFIREFDNDPLKAFMAVGHNYYKIDLYQLTILAHILRS